jgi:hypothetical protein
MVKVHLKKPFTQYWSVEWFQIDIHLTYNWGKYTKDPFHRCEWSISILIFFALL